MRRARTCPWIRTRPYRVLLRGPDIFFAAQFSAAASQICPDLICDSHKGQNWRLRFLQARNAAVLRVAKLLFRLVIEFGYLATVLPKLNIIAVSKLLSLFHGRVIVSAV